MMKYLLLSLLIFSTAAMSADKKMVAQASTNKGITTADKTLDVTPQNVSDAMAKETGLITDTQSMKANISCTTQDGTVIKHGQKGYKKCLKNVKKDKSDVKVKFEN